MEPSLLFDRFAEICRVPRESGNEGGMRCYLEAFAAVHGFAYREDYIGNLVMQIPGRGAGKGANPVILQSHTDMVCVKSPNSSHNFTKDEIRTLIERRVEGGVLQQVLTADGTTLGADNGLGVAAALAAATDPNITHCPPLELLFTIDEERGLTGAAQLDPSLLTGRQLINMDSEELGEICISCAGGRDMNTVWEVKRKAPTGPLAPFRVSLNGLPGGHSGVQINEGRGNAIQMLLQEIVNLFDGKPLFVSELTGGSKRNVIPGTAAIAGWTTPEAAAALQLAVDSQEPKKRIANQLAVGSDSVELIFETRIIPNRPLSDAQSLEIIQAILAIPHGPQTMSDIVPGLVETSNNVAVLTTETKRITLACSTRSSRQNAISEFQEPVKARLEARGALVSFGDGYPGWEADPDNPLLTKAEKVFVEVLGEAPHITAIHAGLECGVLKGIIPDLKMISIGPSIIDPHTVEERVLLNTVAPFYRCLTGLLSALSG